MSDIWTSAVDCHLDPPWGTDPIADWVRPADFPVCIADFTFEDPDQNIHPIVDVPDLNWYDCFCLSMTRKPTGGGLCIFPCGGIMGTHDGDNGAIRLTDSTKDWIGINLAGASVVKSLPSSSVSGIIHDNDKHTALVTVDGTSDGEPIIWNYGDAYAMSGGSMSFTIDTKPGTDCCQQTYEYDYNLTFPCLPNNLAANTSQWFRYIVGCDRTDPGDGHQLSQAECATIWEDTYRALCTPDILKFDPAYVKDRQSLDHVEFTGASTLVVPESFANDRVFRLFSGSLAWTPGDWLTHVEVGDLAIGSSVNAGSLDLSLDILGTAGSPTSPVWPRPVPFEVVGTYPADGGVVDAGILDMLATVRFDPSQMDIGNLVVRAYFEDSPGTPLSIVELASDVAATNYRFYEFTAGSSDSPYVAEGASRTVVVQACYTPSDANYVVWSSEQRATYYRTYRPEVSFVATEPSFGSNAYVSLSNFLASCQLSTPVDSVSLVQDDGWTEPCTTVDDGRTWYYPNTPYPIAAGTYRFRAVKAGASYDSAPIALASGGTASRTADLLAAAVQSFPSASTSIAIGELVQVYRNVPMSSIALSRRGKLVTDGPKATYTAAGSTYLAYVFESPSLTAVNKFFDVGFSGTTVVSDRTITVSSATNTLANSGDLDGRWIILMDAGVEVGRFQVVSSSFASSMWTLSVSSPFPILLPSEPSVALVPDSTYSCSLDKVFSGVTVTEDLSLRYDPSSAFPSRTYVPLQDGRLYRTYPPLADTDSGYWSIPTRYASTQLLVACPEAVAMGLVPGSGPDTPTVGVLPKYEDLKAEAAPMDIGIQGMYSGTVLAGISQWLRVSMSGFIVHIWTRATKDSSSPYPYHDTAAWTFLYPIASPSAAATSVFRVPTVPLRCYTYGIPSTGVSMSASVARLVFNNASITWYVNAGSQSAPYVDFANSLVNIYLASVAPRWSNPDLGPNAYVATPRNHLLLTYASTYNKASTIVGSRVGSISDPCISLTVDNATLVNNTPLTGLYVVSPGWLSLSDTQMPGFDGDSFYMQVAQSASLGTIDSVSFEYPWATAKADFGGFVAPDSPAVVRGFAVASVTGAVASASSTVHHKTITVSNIGNTAEDQFKHRTLQVLGAGGVGPFTILSNTGGALPEFTLDTDAVLPTSLTNMPVEIGMRNSFSQCGLAFKDIDGNVATYKVLSNTPLEGNSITFTLMTRALKPLGTIAAVALEVASTADSLTSDGILAATDSRWGLMATLVNGGPNDSRAFAEGQEPALLVTWRAPADCATFTQVRQQTIQALADPEASYVDCGEGCAFDITINSSSFKCDFGFRVQGRSVNVPGCGGGGFFKDMYLSCPYSTHVRCDRPTAPCNCVFVLSYLLVIPLGSVLL